MAAREYSYGEWMQELSTMIGTAAGEMEKIAREGVCGLKGHLESYSLLETLWLLDNFKDHSGLVESNVPEEEYAHLEEELRKAIGVFDDSYARNHAAVSAAYDQEKMEAEAADYMKPWKEKVEKAEKRLEKMKQLHAVARKASDAFQGHNPFAKLVALHKVRKEAGFRLKRKRVCNFAAKTFDLVNEAQAELNQTRNGLHGSNVTYKCIGDLYQRIYRQLETIKSSLLD